MAGPDALANHLWMLGDLLTARSLSRLVAAASLAAALLDPASSHAASTFFGEDLAAFNGTLPLSLTNSSAAESAFRAQLVGAVTEDFSAFHSGDEAPLDLAFGTLSDPSSDGDGFVATARIAKTGFPISGTTYWKNTTEEHEGLFTIAFDDPVRALGFYATGYQTLSRPGGTALVLRLALAGGGTLDLPIPHTMATGNGKAFYFGVIAEPFVSATLLNEGPRDGDVIGFDRFTAAVQVVPEPSTALLLAPALGALAAARRRRPAHST